MPGFVSAPPAKHRWLYLPDGWDDTWKAAKAAAGSTPAWITVAGDSYVWGASVATSPSDMSNGTWFERLRTALLVSNPHHGDFYSPWRSAEVATLLKSITYRGTPPWVFVATNLTVAENANGLGIGAYWYPAATGNGVFTSPYTCSRLDYVGLDFANGTFDLKVDGGAADTQTISAGGSPYPMRRKSYAGLSVGSAHTLQVLQTSTSVASVTLGAACYKNPTYGLGFAQLAFNGARLGQFLGVKWPSNGGEHTMAGGSAAGQTGFGFPTQPHLELIALGINECQQTSSVCLSADGFERALVRRIQGIRRGRPDASILLVVNSFPDEVTSDVQGSTFNNPQSWPLYIAAMYRVAYAHRCAVVNFQAKWGGRGYALGFQSSNDPHPLDAGHADMAATIGALL